MTGFLLSLGGGNMLGMLIPIGLIVVFIFFSSRSRKKQERQDAEMRDSLAVGDEVTTIGGIIGEIVRIKDETVTIETGKDRTKIRILRSAIRTVDVHAADKYGTPAPQHAPAPPPADTVFSPSPTAAAAGSPSVCLWGCRYA